MALIFSYVKLPTSLCRFISRLAAGEYVDREFSFYFLTPRLIAVIVFTVMIICCYASTQAGMYACRDRSGKINYTNVRNSPSCKPLILKKTNRSGVQSGSRKISPSQYDRDIKRIAGRYKIDPPLIKAIIHTESGFDHRAVSRRGAQGLMQLMPETARELRVPNPFNPRDNIEGGTKYFRQMLDSFDNNLILSLAAYNAGPGLVRRTGGVPKIPETRRYVNKVLNRYKLYKARW